MGGGLMQLVAYGAQDVYLTGNPQITFFKVVYRRHTNFAVEPIQQTWNGAADFGRTVTCTINRNGDLITNMYVAITLNAVSSPSSSWGYVSRLGHAIIDDVKIEIGGSKIDEQYGDWLNIWNELSQEPGHQVGYDNMVGNTFALTGTALAKAEATTLYVPFQFWFCRNPGLALPLIALQYHEVKLNFEFRGIRELTRSDVEIVNPLDIDGSTPSIRSASLWVDYIYLDTDERRRFAQVSHEYLIEQVQFNEPEGIDTRSTTLNSALQLNHPVKELLWVVTRNETRELNTVSGNDLFNFSSTSGGDTFETAKLLFNGHDRMKERDSFYYREVQPYNHHTRTPNKHIYSYSFALTPEEHQPSGSCNMSRLDNVVLNLTFNGTTTVESELRVYAVNYNVLRIMSGMAGLAYSN